MNDRRSIRGSRWILATVLCIAICGFSAFAQSSLPAHADTGTGDSGSAQISTGIVEFTLEDRCNDGDRIEYRFFQFTDSEGGAEITMIWPSEDEYYYMPDYGTGYTSRLTCSSGQLVCFGAREGARGYYGVGFDGDQGCESCCLWCPDGNKETKYASRLTCS